MATHPSPKYRRQKQKGKADRAFVELGGQRHYLGAHGSPASWQAYHRLLAESTAQPVGQVCPVKMSPLDVQPAGYPDTCPTPTTRRTAREQFITHIN